MGSTERIKRPAVTAHHFRGELFPPDSLAEIEAERRASADDLNIRGCRVDIILNDVGGSRLYVVLPTSVEPSLSFSCNAPFLQDPGRKAIKDPVQSPTNRWLLKRIGELAAVSLIQWLQNSTLSIKQRAEAYDLVSHPPIKGTSVTSETTSALLDVFGSLLASNRVVLTADGTLERPGKCVSIPSELFGVWDKKTLLTIFGRSQKHLVAPEVSIEFAKRLRSWWLITLITPGEAAELLTQFESFVPNPGQESVLNLWSFLETAVTEWPYHRRRQARDLPIVPVEGSQRLGRSGEVVSLDSHLKTIPPEIASFLLRFVRIADRSWLRLLAKSGDPDDRDVRIQRSRALQTWIDLVPASVTELFNRAAEHVFSEENPDDDGFELVRLAAEAGISADSKYRYKCRDGKWRSSSQGLLVTPTGFIDRLLPDHWSESRVLDDGYEHGLTASQRLSWREWAGTRAGLSEFPAPLERSNYHYRRTWLDSFCQARGGSAPDRLPYKREYFVCNDVDFDDALWEHWKGLSLSQPTIWVDVIRGLLMAGAQPKAHARVFQRPSSKLHPIDHGPLLARWVLAFQSLPCLVDSFGRPALPAELLRVTPQNAFLQDIERFVHPDLDRPETKWFLDLLGVRTDPTTTEVPLKRLRAIAAGARPPISALAAIYKTLDRLIPYLDSDRVGELRSTFENERLIFARNESWQSIAGVVQQDDAGIPGVLTIHREIAELDLSLWDRLGVAKRASRDRVLEWLNQMPRLERIEDHTLPLVQEVLAAYPSEVWHRCSAWIDMTGRWSPAGDLRWWVTDGKQVRRLFPKIRQATADLTMLQHNFSVRSVFESLKDLGASLTLTPSGQTRIHDVTRPPWLNALAQGLLRLKPRDLNRSDGIQEEHPDVAIARRLLHSGWQSVETIVVVPYLDNEPAGPEVKRKAIWLDNQFMVVGKSAGYFDELVDVLSGQLTDSAVRQAAIACIDRSAGWIQDYLESRFDLLADEPEPFQALPKSDVLGTVDGQPNREERSSLKPGDVGDVETDDDQFSSPEKAPLRPKSGHRLSRREMLISYLVSHGYYQVATQTLKGSEDTTVHLNSGIVYGNEWDAEGNLVGLYWVGTNSLTGGFTIPAEAWSNLDDNAEIAWVILPEPDDTIHAYPFDSLRAQVDIFPAEYRVRLAEATNGKIDFDSASFPRFEDEDSKYLLDVIQDDDDAFERSSEVGRSNVPQSDQLNKHETTVDPTPSYSSLETDHGTGVISHDSSSRDDKPPDVVDSHDAGQPIDADFPVEDVMPIGSKRRDGKYLARVARVRERLNRKKWPR